MIMREFIKVIKSLSYPNGIKVINIGEEKMMPSSVKVILESDSL